MKFELKMNKEQLMEIGRGAGKIGKAIIVEGTKAVALKGAAAVITQSFDEGLGGVKNLGLDDVLKGGKKHNKPKKSLFSFKKKKDVTDDHIEEVALEVETVETVDTNEVK
jgi:hypothetical protein